MQPVLYHSLTLATEAKFYVAQPDLGLGRVLLLRPALILLPLPKAGIMGSSVSVVSNTVEVQEETMWMKDRRKIT